MTLCVVGLERDNPVYTRDETATDTHLDERSRSADEYYRCIITRLL